MLQGDGQQEWKLVCHFWLPLAVIDDYGDKEEMKQNSRQKFERDKTEALT